jgi:hypothetical protein
MTVTTKPGRRGERDISRKTIAQGMPVETGEPVEDYPHFVRATGASDTRHSLRPLFFFGGERNCKPRAQRAARMRNHVQLSSSATANDPTL